MENTANTVNTANAAEITDPEIAAMDKLRSDVQKYIGMAEKILLARFKDKYYKEALKCIDELEKKLAARGESDSSLDAQRADINRRLNEARAYSVVEKYDFACKSREYAKTSEDIGSAALHFKEAAEAREKTKVDPETLSPECRKQYDETAQAAELAKLMEKKASTTYQVTRAKTLGGFIVVILLCAAVLACRHTVTFHAVLGRIEMAIGMNENAVKNYKRAYNRCSSDENLQAYIKASRKAGMAAFKKKNYEDAADYLHLPAVNGDEEASRDIAIAEKALMQDAQIGDQLTFGGTKWMVIDQEGSSLLLVKYEGTSSIPFQENAGESADWANSSLRAYLNGEFLNENFSPDEQTMIEVTDVKAENNPDYGTDAGADTQDQIYLLSDSEFVKYADVINACGHLCWLRTPGAYEGSVSLVGIDKDVMTYGYDAASTSICIKPVMWVNIE